MKNEHTSSTAPLLIGMAAGAALGAAGVMATNTSQRQMRRIRCNLRLLKLTTTGVIKRLDQLRITTKSFRSRNVLYPMFFPETIRRAKGSNS